MEEKKTHTKKKKTRNIFNKNEKPVGKQIERWDGRPAQTNTAGDLILKTELGPRFFPLPRFN